ncbi:MAG: S8 family serine peptidase [Bacteroidetes bacterium]|nr:S8 family serine peptidase [Bacteroidota bacterium]
MSRPPRKDYIVVPVYLRVNAHRRYSGKGITIAFIDSGFYPHPALTKPKNRILKMVDVTSEKHSESDFELVRPSSWHGTMVASVACGSGYHSKSYYRGIAHDANVVLIKAFDGKSIRSQNIHKALTWVIRNHKKYGIRVVNVSLGGDREQSAKLSRICRAVEQLTLLGITVVAAAGNNPGRRTFPPASCPHAITVGGVDDQNSSDTSRVKEYGTSHGRTTDGFMKPEILAPSKHLPSPMLPDNEVIDESEVLHELFKTPLKLLPSKLKRRIRKTRLDPAILKVDVKAMRAAIGKRLEAEKFFAPNYQHVDGTSFAAPIVSSIIAQMLEANPNLTPGLIKMILTTTARRLPDIAAEKQGFGLITPLACVERALVEDHLDADQESPVITEDRIVFYYHDHVASKVSVLGDFTAWMKDMLLMTKVDDGLWRADIPLLTPGRYHYKFLVDDTKWTPDPANPNRENDHYNGMNSVLVVSQT